MLVNRPQIMIGHVLEGRPWHDLEKIAVEGKLQAVGWSARPGSTIRVNMIEICALPQDLTKLFKGVSTFRQPRLVRGQVTGVKMWN